MFGVLGLVACAGAGCARSAQGDIDAVVQTHRRAERPEDIENACRDAFLKARGYPDPQELCAELERRPDRELVVCEDEIQSPEFYDLVKFCKVSLDAKIKKINGLKNMGVTTTVELIDFQLPFTVQAREMPAGYVAVTGDTSKKQVILSFDDGPHPVNTQKVLDILGKSGVKAHFFVLGANVKKFPAALRTAAQIGHSIGNHSWSHPDFTKITDAEQARQITETHQIIVKTLGWADPFFRFPYGSSTVSTKLFLKQHGFANFLWSVDSNDWRKVNADGSLRTNLQVIEETVTELEKTGRGLILFHDVLDRTVQLLPDFLKRLYQRGYTVTVLQPVNMGLKNIALK